MNFSENLQSNEHLHQEIGILRQRIADLESGNKPTTYANFLFENSGETILIIDPYTMKILDANPNAARRLGYSQADLRQMSLDEIEMPRSPDINDAETSWQSTTSGTFFYEGQYRHKDGSLIPMEVSSRLVFLEGRDVLINFVRNIRWRKEAEMALRLVNDSLEQQVRQQTAELLVEKDKLETILGSIAEGVAMTDPEKKIVYMNHAFMQMTNYRLAEAQTLTIDQFFDCSVRDRQAQAAAFAKGVAWSGEVIGIRQDGNLYPAVLTVVPMLDANGRLTGYVTSHQDISRFKALDKAQYSFITNVSHQLRTPLTNIKLYTQLLEENFDTQKAPHYLGVLNEQARRLEHLVQDILEMASMESSHLVLNLQQVNMAEMIFQMTDTYQTRAAAKNQTLSCAFHNEIPSIKADAPRLRQAIVELLDNAFAYTPPKGSISIDVEALTARNRQWVTVAVRDDGPGILPEEQTLIFERFFRGRPAEQGHIIGTGLGLCISQELVRAHQGHVTIKSKPGMGTTFTIWLPVEEV